MSDQGKPIFANAPVILAQMSIQANMDSTIPFPTPVYEILEIKNRTKLTQCRFLLGSNKLFIKGSIRKMIYYIGPRTVTRTIETTLNATRVHFLYRAVENKPQALTIEVPFSCWTTLNFLAPPRFLNNETTKEVDFAVSERDYVIGRVDTEMFNELPVCELLSSQISESNAAIDLREGRRLSGILIPIKEKSFTEMDTKMVIEMQINVLQKQELPFLPLLDYGS